MAQPEPKMPSCNRLVDDQNPFEALIVNCDDDPARLQESYAAHRSTRNSQQRAKILDSSFQGWSIDTTLARLEGPARDPNFVDPRHCLVLWARPPASVRGLVRIIQDRLQKVAPSLWLMPLERLHLTVLELAHSLTEPEIEDIIASVSGGITDIVNYPSKHRTRLFKPTISYDVAGLALSFIPAVDGATRSNANEAENSHYTYHHLRRDIFSLVNGLGAKVASRYIVPSAHITIARFISQDGFVGDGGSGDGDNSSLDTERVRQCIGEIDSINTWLEEEYWPRGDGWIPAGGDWAVGEEGGLDYRKGRLWYGGGESIVVREI